MKKKRERGIEVSDNDIQKGWDSVQDKLRMRMRKIESLCVCTRKKERKIERQTDRERRRERDVERQRERQLKLSPRTQI